MKQVEWRILVVGADKEFVSTCELVLGNVQESLSLIPVSSLEAITDEVSVSPADLALVVLENSTNPIDRQALEWSEQLADVPVLVLVEPGNISRVPLALDHGAVSYLVLDNNWTLILPALVRRVIGLNQSQDGNSLVQDLVYAKRMEAVASLAGGIAHDFNNLLSGILGYANLIHALCEDDETLAGYSQIIEDSCVRAADLTQQLLQFSRQRTKVTEIFDINSVVRYVYKIMLVTMKTSIRLLQRISSHSLQIKGDPAQIQQMMLNLCINVNDTMTEGKVTLSTRAEVVREGDEWSQRGLAAGKHVLICLSDTGRAIDEESLKSLLDYEFSNNPNKDPFSLGFSMVDVIARSHGGRVFVDMGSDGGTTVSIMLPRHTPAMEKHEEEREKPLRGEESVLVISEEEVVRSLLQSSLTRLGYRVIPANTTADGITLFEQLQDEIHLVIFDTDLHSMLDPASIAEDIRKIKADQAFVFVVGDPKMEKSLKAKRFAHAQWVHKPINLGRLTHGIRFLLDREASNKN